MFRALVFIAVVAFAAAGDLNLSDKCLGCLCEAATGCNVNTCQGSICGPFSLTWAYWSDAGSVGGDFGKCATDYKCAGDSVKNYMAKHQQDCNGDGKIDCDDFFRIHFLGAYGCRNSIQEIPHAMRYSQCKARVGGFL